MSPLWDATLQRLTVCDFCSGLVLRDDIGLQIHELMSDPDRQRHTVLFCLIICQHSIYTNLMSR